MRSESETVYVSKEILRKCAIVYGSDLLVLYPPLLMQINSADAEFDVDADAEFEQPRCSYGSFI